MTMTENILSQIIVVFFLFLRITADRCNLDLEETKVWLEGIGVLEQHSSKLYANLVDGEVLCYAPVPWLAEKLTLSSSTHSSHSTTSSTHECTESATKLVNEAVDIWHGNNRYHSDPASAIDALTSALKTDSVCCAPYREFSRLFLGSNSPFIQIKVQSEKEKVLRKVIGLSKSDYIHPEWRELASYAAAHSLYFTDKIKASHQIFQNLFPVSDTSHEDQLGTIINNKRNNQFEVARSSKLLVATVASKRNEELENLEESAREGGSELQVLGLGQKYEGHETKLRLYDQFLSSPHVSPMDLVLLVDAYDVLLSPAIKDLPRKFEKFNRPIVLAAEHTLWPDSALEESYPSSPTELKFLNSGTIVGRAWALRFMFKTVRSYGALSLCGPDDQRAFHRFFLQNRQLVALDYHADLFLTLHFLTDEVIVDGKGQVHAGDKTPCAVHGNGGDGKAAYDRLVEGWKKSLASGLSNSVSPPPFSAGIALYTKGDLEGAEKWFRQGMTSAREPKQQVNCAYNLAVVLTEKGLLDESSKVYEKVLSLDPTHDSALLNFASLKMHFVDSSSNPRPLLLEARDLLQTSLKHNPGNDLGMELLQKVNTLL